MDRRRDGELIHPGNRFHARAILESHFYMRQVPSGLIKFIALNYDDALDSYIGELDPGCIETRSQE